MHNLKKLARAIVPKSSVHILEKSYRVSRGVFWQTRYGFPARGARVIAITGTNGKSTTCAYINEVLKAAGYRTAVLTTVFYEIDGRREPNKTHFTIDRQFIVQNFLFRARRADVDWVILEVTSHAIDQDRILGVPVKIAVITNLTQDHLDYHGTMKDYAATKARLLSNRAISHVVLNADDKWFNFFKNKTPKGAEIFSVGSKPRVTGRISKPKITAKGGSITFATNNHQMALKTSLLGEFNLINAALAAAVGSIFLLDNKIITRGIANVKSLEGRMDPVEAGQNFSVLVDFAITPDALEKALKSLQKIAKGKVRVVFGATGDRDKDKRPKMGSIAARCADFIYLTDDETYTEDPDKIRDDVLGGIKKSKGSKKTEVIPDRKAAIEKAIKDAKTGDIVLLAGIGHETERNMGGKQIPWSEHDIAKKAIKSR